MLVAVTGGTGFVGAHSVRALVDAGHDVRLLVAPGEDVTATLGALGVDPRPDAVVAGDVRDPAALDRLLDGADALLHAAGVVGVDDRREALMWEVNVQATATVLARAVALDLDPVVHVSTYAALYPDPTGTIGPDTDPAAGTTAYGRTKAAADRIARGFQDAGAPLVITYPSSVVGPAAGSRRGITADGWAPLLRFGAALSLDASMMMVDVRDVAAVHAAAMEPGRGPRRFLCGGTMTRMDDVIAVLTRPRRGPRLRVNAPLLRAGGAASGLASRVGALPPGFSREAARLLTAPQLTDDSLTLELLGRAWTPVARALADATAAGART